MKGKECLPFLTIALDTLDYHPPLHHDSFIKAPHFLHILIFNIAYSKFNTYQYTS